MRQKRLTRKDKMKCTSNGVCWKCGSKFTKERGNLVCPDCGFSPPR